MLVTRYITRAQWGAAPPRSAPTILPMSQVERIFIHYTGTNADEMADHANCAARVRGVQRFHQSPTPSDPTKPWNEIDAAVVAEGTDALFFNAKSGAFTFLDRGYRSASPWSSVQATFDDRGVAGVPYADASLASGEAFIFNDVRVTREGGELQRTFDTASIARFGRRVLSRDGLIVNSDADASTEATDLLAKYKDPFVRVSNITLAGRPETAAQLFSRELGDYVRVIRHPPGGGTIDESSYIRRIHLEADAHHPWPRGSFSITPR